MVENEKQHPQFISLSPRDDLNEERSVNFNPNFKHYESKLLWAIENRKKENIKNIAITGYYGAGKSSILKTFIKTHDKKQNTSGSYKFLELSLATFHDDKKGADKVKDIEKSLLQQIFYKVEDDQIPNSRLKKISNKINFNFFEQGLICFIVIALLVRFYNLIFDIEPFFGFYWLDVGLMITTLFFFLLQVDKINQLSFKKISYRNLEVELEKNKGELSVLSRFLDEIIYFFKETKYNVVVIEDIDRFESTEIFSNLRELNLILNNSDLIKEHVVFIYAIKNEQFKTASDRTKFFDFIIPVIPVVNFETSAALFYDSLKNNNSAIDIDEIDKKMVNSLFFLVDDIRVIHNISNELKTYFKILEKDGFYNDNENLDKKLSLVNRLIPLLFYKNVEPYDFSLLLKRKGFLYSIIQNEENLRFSRKEKFIKKIENIKSQIKLHHEKKYRDLDELKMFILMDVLSKIYIIKSQNQNINDVGFEVNDEIIGLKKIESLVDEFDKIFEEKHIKIALHGRGGHQISKVEIENKLGYSIDEKLEAFKNSYFLENVKNEIEDIQSKIKSIDNLNLSEIIDNNEIDKQLNSIKELLEFNESVNKDSPNRRVIKNQPNFEIIKLLILNDYINKDYFLYLSDFSKLGMSQDDYKFLLSLKNRRNIGFHQEIDNPEVIINKLSKSDFNSSAILNFSFVNFLLGCNEDDFEDFLDITIAKIVRLKSNELSFLNSFFKKCNELDSFINLLAQKSPTLFEDIDFSESLNVGFKKIFFESIIKYASIKDIKKQSYYGRFYYYIYDNDNFLSIRKNPNETIDIIDELHLNFEAVNFDADKSILEFIFEHKTYVINKANIYGFLKFFGFNLDELSNNQLLTLVKQEDSLIDMKNYIYSNNELEPFIKNIILQNPANTKEEGSVVLEILNMPNEKIDIDTRIQFLEQQETVIKDVTEIEELELRITVLKNQRMSPELDNVLCYLNPIREIEKTEDRNALIFNIIKFITENKQVLEEYDETQRVKIQKLIDLCISSNKIDNELYVKFITILVDELPDKHFEFTGQSNLNADKIKILIEENYLDLNEDNIEYLIRESQQELLPYLFEKNEDEIKTYLKYSIHAITEDVAISILKSQISQDIKTEIVNNRFTEFKNNEPFFILALQQIVIISGVDIRDGIKQHLVNYNLDNTNIPKIFNAISDALDKSQIKTFFENQKDEQYNKLSKYKKRPHFKNTEDNIKMLNKLHENDLKIISGYDSVKDNLKVKHVNKY